MKRYTDRLKRTIGSAVFAGVCLVVFSACASKPQEQEIVVPDNSSPAFSVTKVVHSDHSMITLLDPADLVHHQSQPANWFLHDFAIKDDLQSGRFAAVLTGRPGKFNVRVTFGELSQAESAVAGAEAKMRLRVRNNRLLLSGGDTWPSEEFDHRNLVRDARWINIPNGDYGVIITVLKPGAASSDYVFQLIRVNDMTKVKHAPAVPKLTFGDKAGVVGVNAKGFQYNEQCLDVPAKASWVPLVARTMPIPGAREVVELPKSMHAWAIEQQQAGKAATIPVVMSRDPEAGTYGFYIKPRNWNKEQVQKNGDVLVDTLIRCAVEITGVAATPSDFSLSIRAVPTASDRIPGVKKQQLITGLDQWLRTRNDPDWLYKVAKVKRSADDGAMILGVMEYLKLSSKETEKLLPMSNALRVNFILDRFD